MTIQSAVSPSTIHDAEQVIQNSLEALRKAPLSETIASGLEYLVPDGYRIVVELQEGGRKKRNTAAAVNWNPAAGEIVIYFEPISVAPSVSRARTQMPESSAPLRKAPIIESQEISSLQIQQCCEALAETEKEGRQFIALKWFRDEALSAYSYDWIASPEMRQRVLAKAIDTGAIQTQKIPNPKSPRFPTTVINLNRSYTSIKTTSRFHPIAIKGEPLSHTIMRERGSLLIFHFIDSSALVKLFIAEPGSPSMIELFERTEDRTHLASAVTLVEARSAIRRRQFAGDTTAVEADEAVSALAEESRRLIVHQVTSSILETALGLVDQHNLRSLDAIQLASALLAQTQLSPGEGLIFVASDKRLLLAAQNEGLDTFDPTDK